MSRFEEFTNKNRNKVPHKVWFLFFDGHQALDIAGPVAALSAANDLFPDSPPYDIKLVANRAGVVTSNSALRIIADSAWQDLEDESVDTLIVAGIANEGEWNAPVTDFVASVAGRVQRICSICTGAFLLGAAGLLDGKRVATHWSAIDALKELYPSAIADKDAIYSVDGRIWTSAGVTAGLDMILALIEADHGHEVAVSIARRLVVYMIRPGGQAQFSIHVNDIRRKSDTIIWILSEIDTNISRPMTVKALADRCNMSVRNFSRRFKDEVGQSPADFIISRRLARAQSLLERSDIVLKSIAGEAGFTSTSAFRRAFATEFAITPNEYRSRFRSQRNYSETSA